MSKYKPVGLYPGGTKIVVRAFLNGCFLNDFQMFAFLLASVYWNGQSISKWEDLHMYIQGLMFVREAKFGGYANYKKISLLITPRS